MEVKISKTLTDDGRMLRMEVFIDEQGFEHELDDIDEVAAHAVLYEDGKPLAVGRTFEKADDDSVYMIGRLAVKKTERKRGLGTAVMRALENYAKDMGAKETELFSQLHACEFYEMLGYIAYGDIVYEEGCPHICMRKQLGE